MISIKKYLKLSVLIAFGAFLTSCEQDTNLSLEIQESVYLRFNTTPDPILTTRATGSVDDSVAESTTIKDLNVFIWNNLFSYHKYYTSVSVATMQIIAGNYHIVAIGNAGKDLGNADVSTLHTTTLAQLDIDTYNNAVMTYMGELSTTAGTNISAAEKNIRLCRLQFFYCKFLPRLYAAVVSPAQCSFDNDSCNSGVRGIHQCGAMYGYDSILLLKWHNSIRPNLHLRKLPTRCTVHYYRERSHKG